MRKGLLTAIAFFAATSAVGYFAGQRSWNGVIYLTDGSVFGNARNPAAIKRELDFSRLDGAELITATQRRLVTAARVVLSEGQIGLELGHFVTRGADGQRRLACDSTYNRLTLRFEADGIASGGEKPSMEIDGPCRTSQANISSIEPIWIPVMKLLKSKPVNMDVSFNEDAEGVRFRFDAMTGNWPVRWSLQSVRLYSDDDPSRVVDITTSELREIRKGPLVLDWLEARRSVLQNDAKSEIK